MNAFECALNGGHSLHYMLAKGGSHVTGEHPWYMYMPVVESAIESSNFTMSLLKLDQ